MTRLGPDGWLGGPESVGFGGFRVRFVAPTSLDFPTSPAPPALICQASARLLRFWVRGLEFARGWASQPCPLGLAWFSLLLFCFPEPGLHSSGWEGGFLLVERWFSKQTTRCPPHQALFVPPFLILGADNCTSRVWAPPDHPWDEAEPSSVPAVGQEERFGEGVELDPNNGKHLSSPFGLPVFLPLKRTMLATGAPPIRLSSAAAPAVLR